MSMSFERESQEQPRTLRERQRFNVCHAENCFQLVFKLTTQNRRLFAIFACFYL